MREMRCQRLNSTATRPKAVTYSLTATDLLPVGAYLTTYKCANWTNGRWHLRECTLRRINGYLHQASYNIKPHVTDLVVVEPGRCRSLLNAAARMVVKKRKWDSIPSTIRDSLHWLSDAIACRLWDLSTGLQVSSRARRPIGLPRVDYQSGFGSLYTLPFALCRSRWPGCAADQNSWLWALVR